LTIWDLPTNINEAELKYMCRSIKDVRVTKIKRSQYKALAVIEAGYMEEKNIPWAIPVGNSKLARVTKGKEDYETRDKQGQFTAKLLDVPRGASEVLLLRCLRNKGAKAVYIPHNRNGNQRKFAIVTFANAEEADKAQTSPIWYNNHRVAWENGPRKEKKRSEEFRGRSVERSRTRQENYKHKQGEDNEITNSHRDESIEPKSKKEGTWNQIQKEVPYAEDILLRILDRLERLEQASYERAITANRS
jgi:hypothetical protein